MSDCGSVKGGRPLREHSIVQTLRIHQHECVRTVLPQVITAAGVCFTANIQLTSAAVLINPVYVYREDYSYLLDLVPRSVQEQQFVRCLFT